MEHCIVCGHPLGDHPFANDGYVCTAIYIDPLDDSITYCTCTRPCCLEEWCPNSPHYQGVRTVSWGGGNQGRHWCCLCLDA